MPKKVYLASFTASRTTRFAVAGVSAFSIETRSNALLTTACSDGEAAEIARRAASDTYPTIDGWYDYKVSANFVALETLEALIAECRRDGDDSR